MAPYFLARAFMQAHPENGETFIRNLSYSTESMINDYNGEQLEFPYESIYADVDVHGMMQVLRIDSTAFVRSTHLK